MPQAPKRPARPAGEAFDPHAAYAQAMAKYPTVMARLAEAHPEDSTIEECILLMLRQWVIDEAMSNAACGERSDSAYVGGRQMAITVECAEYIVEVRRAGAALRGGRP